LRDHLTELERLIASFNRHFNDMIEEENKKKSLGFRLDEIKEIDEEIKTLQNTSKKYWN
jgi:hypothetical protein